MKLCAHSTKIEPLQSRARARFSLCSLQFGIMSRRPFLSVPLLIYAHRRRCMRMKDRINCTRTRLVRAKGSLFPHFNMFTYQISHSQKLISMCAPFQLISSAFHFNFANYSTANQKKKNTFAINRLKANSQLNIQRSTLIFCSGVDFNAKIKRSENNNYQF